MRAVGVDLSSAGIAAIGVAVNGVAKSAPIWTPEKNASNPERLLAWEQWLTFKLSIIRPDIVAVEEASFAGRAGNTNVIRALARFEGVALLVAKKRCSLVINPPVSSARKHVFGKGNISKDDAWKQVARVFPGFEFLRKTTGGTDQMDALTHAVAAPKILEGK
jgi:Holliday junction resolvasome RuvABC endonuclease subunit